jgi:PKD repeat protein
VRTLALSIALLLTSAAPALAVPTVDFTPPATPTEGQPGSYTPSVEWDTATPGSLRWNFSGTIVNAPPGAESHTFASGGLKQVTLEAVSGDDPPQVVATATHDVLVSAVVDFNFAPVSPLPFEQVLFAAIDPDESGATWTWDFGDLSGGSGLSILHPYGSPGERSVILRVTGPGGLDNSTTRQIVVRDPNGPTPSIAFSPGVPTTGDNVTFRSTSVPSAGTITGYGWDLDNDGEYDDGAGATATRSFALPGVYAVGLRVTQTNGNSAAAEVPVRVNGVPVAGFVWSPRRPLAGDPVELVSTSADAEGLVSVRWDLDDDGQFDDGDNAEVFNTFAAGQRRVGIRVADGDGAVRSLYRTISIASVPVARPGFITPAPVVRLSGQVLANSVEVDLLSVRAPRGATARVQCKGRGCPVKVLSKKTNRRGVRFKAFERRLRAGIRLVVFIRQGDLIGRYTKFTIRKGRAPKRLDRCLMPSRQGPSRCP